MEQYQPFTLYVIFRFILQCVRKVAVHLKATVSRFGCQYRSCRWSVLLFHCIQSLNSDWSAIPVKCVIVSFDWNRRIMKNESITFYKCTATFLTHCTWVYTFCVTLLHNCVDYCNRYWISCGANNGWSWCAFLHKDSNPDWLRRYWSMQLVLGWAWTERVDIGINIHSSIHSFIHSFFLSFFLSFLIN
jgi:hypothetical protein